jgi:hypothetical protein
MRTNIALVAGLWLAFASGSALAEPKQGSQLTLEQFFGAQPAKKKKVVRHGARSRKAHIETGSIAPPSETTSCLRFDSTVSQTITVPCH